MRHLYWLCISFAIAMTLGVSQVTGYPSGDKCGVMKGRTGRITNGSLATSAQFPWMASIKTDRNVHFCGGSIISNRWVLSAAHCFREDDSTYKDWSVVLGEYSQAEEESHSVTYRIKDIQRHENFKFERPIQNDIVLLELEEEIKWSEYIQPVCLPEEDIVQSDSAIATGWGEGKPWEENEKLRFVELSIYETERCNQMYTQIQIGFTIKEDHLCAGVANMVRDTSKGDSGGPLLVTVGGRAVLAGITSMGSGSTDAPAIYTRVFNYVDWIRGYTKTKQQ